jgi:hypothetical protein
LVSAAAARLHSYEGRIHAGFQLNTWTWLNWPKWLLDNFAVGRGGCMSIAHAIWTRFNWWAFAGITLTGTFVMQPCTKPSWMVGRETIVRPPYMKRGNPSIPRLIHMNRERLEWKNPSIMGRVCCHTSDCCNTSDQGCLQHFLCRRMRVFLSSSSCPIRGTNFLWVWDDNCLPKKLQTGFLDSWWIFFRQLTVTVVLL